MIQVIEFTTLDEPTQEMWDDITTAIVAAGGNNIDIMEVEEH